MTYIYNDKDWPHFTWDPERLVRYLSTARYKQGLLLGKMQDLGYQLKSEATLAVLTEETVKSHIKSLRMKLRTVGAPEDLIETVHGLGYRLKQLA